MMPTTTQAILTIAVVAIVTLFCRALPFLLFRDNRPIPGLVVYLGKVLPFSIIAILVIYCLKDIAFFSAPYGIPEIIAVSAVMILHLWKRNNLISIGGGTVLYMIMVQFIFI